jgi:hypothetical protein
VLLISHVFGLVVVLYFPMFQISFLSWRYMILLSPHTIVKKDSADVGKHASYSTCSFCVHSYILLCCGWTMNLNLGLIPRNLLNIRVVRTHIILPHRAWCIPHEKFRHQLYLVFSFMVDVIISCLGLWVKKNQYTS